jgi:drug/metabolite transporter (DMT)-like permease
MIGIILALLSAAASGFSVVVVRRNSAGSNAFNMSLIITLVGMPILWPLAFLMMGQETINVAGLVLFGLSGFLSPGIVRLFYYRGLRKLGASVNSSVFSIYPLYGAFLAVILLSESLSGANWVGILCIAAGVVSVQLSTRGNGAQEKSGTKSLIFPVLGGITIAVGNVTVKYALTISDAPAFGVAEAYTFSLLPYMLILLFSTPTQKELNLKRDLRFFWLAGIGQAVSWILTFAALHFEKVSITNPLISTEPLFVVFFAFFLLRKVEHVSKKLIASITLTVLGIVLVTL